MEVPRWIYSRLKWGFIKQLHAKVYGSYFEPALLQSLLICFCCFFIQQFKMNDPNVDLDLPLNTQEEILLTDKQNVCLKDTIDKNAELMKNNHS